MASIGAKNYVQKSWYMGILNAHKFQTDFASNGKISLQKCSATKIVKSGRQKWRTEASVVVKYSESFDRVFLFASKTTFHFLRIQVRRAVGEGGGNNKIHPFKVVWKRETKKGERVLRWCVVASTWVLSGHGNGCQLFFSFPPLRASSNLPLTSLSAFLLLDLRSGFRQTGDTFLLFVSLQKHHSPFRGQDMAAICAMLEPSLQRRCLTAVRWSFILFLTCIL